MELIMTTEDLLKTIGKSTFVKYFNLFETQSSKESILEAFKDENWLDSSKTAKANAGMRIFKEDHEIDALRIIMSSSGVSPECRNSAKLKYNQYRLGEDEVEQESKAVDRVQELLVDIYKFADKEGLDTESLINSLIENINLAMDSDRKLVLNETSEGIKFEVHLTDNVMSLIPEDSETPKDITRFRVGDNEHREAYLLTNKAFFKEFRSRLGSQDRKYKNGMYYSIRLFNRLDVNFKDIINTQLTKISVYINQNNKYIKINVDTLIAIEQTQKNIFGVLENGDKVDLYFKYNNEYHLFHSYVTEFSAITLGHVTSMWSILDDNKDNLPTLKQLSDIITKEDVGHKDKLVLGQLTCAARKVNLNEAKLKEELAIIEGSVEFELIPRKINSSTGKK